jgi:hypothetical protein
MTAQERQKDNRVKNDIHSLAKLPVYVRLTSAQTMLVAGEFLT